MKYTPRLPSHNDNISQESHLKEFFILSGGILAVCFSIYFLLGLSADVVAKYIPVEYEQQLGAAFLEDVLKGDSNHGNQTESFLQSIVDRLAEGIEGDKLKYRVHLIKEETVNALALPGGRILVFEGFLKQVKSENELAMVLAHEIGHFVHRDHLRGLGRGLVFLTISTLLGVESIASDFFGGTVGLANLKFSRTQEEKADEFGLKLLNKAYGHVGGAIDFFERMSKAELDLAALELFSSHPLSDDRVFRINKIIQREAMVIGEKKPWTYSAKEE